MPSKSFSRILLLFSGSISLGLGVVGVFVPVLPTTPFLLLSSYCFVRSSKKLNDWLLQNRLVGRYLHNYLEHRGIEKAAFIKSLIFLWLTLGLAIFFNNNFHLRIFLFFVGMAVSVHISLLKRIE